MNEHEYVELQVRLLSGLPECEIYTKSLMMLVSSEI